MPLSPEAKTVNLEKSLAAWIDAKVRVLAGLAVFYSDAPLATRPTEWVHVDYLLGLRRDAGRQLDRTQLGNRVHGAVQLSLAKKRTSITDLYAMGLLRDAVMPYFQWGQTIPIRNYGAAGNPEISAFEVGATGERDTDDGLSSGVMVKVLDVALTHVEAYTLV